MGYILIKFKESIQVSLSWVGSVLECCGGWIGGERFRNWRRNREIAEYMRRRVGADVVKRMGSGGNKLKVRGLVS